MSGAHADAETVTRMTRALAHRGPDDDGIWVDREAGLALGHRRLSIIDLSPAGHQPMLSVSGRYVLTYNGEIYNYEDLRRELAQAGHCPEWRGHSDTEVMLAGFDFWGIKATLERAIGMFGIAVWDRQERALTLARDRLGEKPLYYGRQRPGGPFLFGSELKALLQHPEFDAEVDREALSLLLRYLAVPEPLSIYRGIAKLLPGTMLTVREGCEPVTDTYWSGAEIAQAGIANPIELTAEAAADELEAVLDRAVGRQMVSDVPLGAFLSGGVDSSTVVAIMQKLSPRPVKTFTVGFAEEGYNEAPHAKAVARHLGTDHTELYVSPAQAMEVIPKLPTMYDEPFADSSQIPTHLISALARQHVTVALSGDGGDELFGGYERYRLTAGLWEKIARVPKSMRAAASTALTAVPAPAWNRLGGWLPASVRMQRLGEKLHKGASMLTSSSADELYDQMLSLWRDPTALVVGAPPSVAQPLPVSPGLDGIAGAERMMAQDMLGYLSNDILAKVDRAAMAVSLETRVPLLDPEVVEFAWRLPLDLKLRRGTTKWLLRQVLYRHVPRALIERPKMGFGVPLDAWLCGPLRDWAEALLDERRLREEGFFRP
ncbi:MAG: asparagine synthase (glutamine-hydrolyzing), partial [Sphingomonas sp.]|nr:asparagine synthase (glutamine-hydrolyzing) [Sphingomonas sp.]